MAETILYGIAQEVLEHLGSTLINDIVSAWGFKSRLTKLNNTINTIKDVLLDAEERQANSHAVRGWLERLTTAVYAADDLFDEFATLVAQKQLSSSGNKMNMEVRTFFSSSNQLASHLMFRHSIKRIRKELDGIVKDGTQFCFALRPHEIGRGIYTCRKRDETYSFVDAKEVIGRDADKKAVLDLLLSSSCADEPEVLPVIPIVGMGGLGKTTLAQLIYNDPQVQDCFELKLWVCVSYVFDLTIITKKILMSATNNETQKLEMEQLQGLLRKEIGDKKYLLVLDDVWNEDREEWLKLRSLLKIGRLGSKILVTSRSRKVAKIMGTVPLYELQGLSEEEAWDLFKKVAFEPGQAQQKPHLVQIGKEIVQKCANVPLAIRSLGSLLYGEDDNKWFSLKDTSLSKIPENDIMNILKLSYHHLWSPLKNCFAYCALFPKDYEFDKEMLIELWMAEGFIIPIVKEDQSLYKVGEQYFLTLLHRGFFQDIKLNEWGDIKSCKMHDLMHDLALEVAGVKCKVAEIDEHNFDEKTLHLSFSYPLNSSWEIPNTMLNLKQLRTILLLEQMKDAAPFGDSTCQQLLSRFYSLRVLNLNHLGLKNLPSSVDKLIHLRYLNLSHTPIKKLPDSIADLWNLQTLTLHDCRKLKTLPKDIRKLANLRSLNVSRCDGLIHMPSGIGGLTLLNNLPRFIVGHESSTCAENSAKLSDLKNLNNLRGVLEINIHRTTENNFLEAAEAELSHKYGFTDLGISFSQGGQFEDEFVCDHDEAVLEGLKPHSNIRILHIDDYSGRKLPSWVRMDNLSITLPNLVRITLWNCGSCQQLPSFSKLRFLKHLEIFRVVVVEYMESSVNSMSSNDQKSLETLFFPSLEALELEGMINLKGWWKKGESIEYDKESESTSSKFAGPFVPSPMQFSKLSKLKIVRCPNLRMLPLCPFVKDLTLRNANKRMSVLGMATTTPCTSSGSGLKLKRLTIDNAEDLISLPIHCLHQLSDLTIIDDRKLESSERLGEVFATLSSSLRSLNFHNCDTLRSISKGLQHLTVLEVLRFKMCEELDITGNEDEDGGMPWKAFNTSLRSLELFDLDKLVGLPSGFQHLTNLRTLELSSNDELEELPDWISCFTSLEYLELWNCPKLNYLPESFSNLTSLKHLQIKKCPGLTERCQRPNGSDLHKIQHIPLLSVLD